MKQKIFSGIQPSGTLHIGNYLGAIRNWVDLQNKYEAIFCVVDLHAITVYQKPEDLRRTTIDIAKTYLASGIDPDKSIIFIQSHVPAHSELGWIMNTLVKISELERMTQFKDKSKQHHQNVNAGLFTYPSLMAADILLYDANLVPVGEDQLQHIELTRVLARRFNQTFKKTFTEPEPFVVKEGMRIMALDDPLKKMSKSAESANSYIALTDKPDKVRSKIKKAVTDSGKDIVYSKEKPAIMNLINIFSLLDNVKPKEVEEIYQAKSYAEFKNDLAEVVVNFLEPFQERYNELSDQEVLRILEAGAEKAQKLAEKKMEEVKNAIGLI